MDDNKPQLGGRYQVRAKLGQGGMGTVYCAYDRLTQEQVALKRVNVPSDELQFKTISSEPVLALALEFRVLAGLRHPHIVTVLDYGFDAQQFPYFTMQLLENAQPITQYAAALIERGKIRLLIETLQALVYLHRRGIIHRDLKPENVLVTWDGRIKVMDFGLALQTDTTTKGRVAMAGTLYYMAPELFTGEPASIASDLYAFGAICYEIFAGNVPFHADSVNVLISQILIGTADLTPLPPALQPIILRLLDKRPAQRYTSAEEIIEALCAATDAPLPPESSLLRESFLQASAFVGRETELGQLEKALDAVRHGQGSAWLIGGESGVGKSRLLDELRIRALISETLVLRGHTVAEGGLPYDLWRDVARRLVLNTPVSDLEAGVLKELVPDIATLLEREVANAPELTGPARQQRLSLTLIDLLKRQTLPVVLLLEDLQWAAESLALVRQLLLVVDQLPHVLLIATYRDDERPRLPEELPGMQILKLPRLSEEAVARLTRAMLGEAAQPPVVTLVQRETEGNAFFMVETVRALAEEAGSLSAVGAKTLPPAVFTGGVLRIVARRLNRLPESLRPLLKQSAIAGRALDLNLLRRLDGERLDEFLTTGANASVLEVVDGVWRFSHDKLREGVIASLEAEEGRTLHGIIAAGLEALYGENKAYQEILFDHWHAAGNVERELHYLAPVSWNLNEVLGDYQRAQQLCEWGLTLLPADDARRASLLCQLSRIAWRKGDQEEAARRGHESLEAAQRSMDKPALALSLNNLGNLAMADGDYAAAQTYFEQSMALRRETGDIPGLGWSLNNLGVLAYERGEWTAAQDFYEQGLGQFRAIDHKQGLASCLNNMGNVASDQHDFAKSRACYEESLALRREIDNRQGIGQSLFNLGVLAYDQQDYATAQAYYEQSMALARELGDKPGLVIYLSSVGELQMEQGLPQVKDTLREGIELCLKIQAPVSLLDFLVILGLFYARIGRMEQAALLAGLIEANPTTRAESRRSLGKLLAQLEASLPPEQLTAWLASGAGLEAMTFARELLVQSWD